MNCGCYLALLLTYYWLDVNEFIQHIHAVHCSSMGVLTQFKHGIVLHVLYVQCVLINTLHYIGSIQCKYICIVRVHILSNHIFKCISCTVIFITCICTGSFLCWHYRVVRWLGTTCSVGPICFLYTWSRRRHQIQNVYSNPCTGSSILTVIKIPIICCMHIHVP